MNNLSFGKARIACLRTGLPFFFRVIKATIFLFFFLITASALGNAQNISINLKNAKLEEVFKQISLQTNYKFLYNDEVLKKSGTVTVNLQNVNVLEVLHVVLPSDHYQFKINDETVAVTRKESDAKTKTNRLEELQQRISGKITGADGKALAGVTINVKNSSVATIADEHGNYSIQADGSAVLVFKYIGYKGHEVAVRNRNVVNVSLQLQDSEIEEVVVTGLGAKIDRRTFTGATTKVEMKDIELGGLPDPSRALEGRVAGVIVQNTTGTFGTAPKIRVRGATSIYGNSKPLWVIDGIIIEDVADVGTDALSSGDALTLISSAVAGLNANDIESFQVLKDGSATSIYGARAMGGVIVITTKTGKAGRNSFNYSSEYTFRAKPSYSTFNVMNSQEQMGVYQFLEQRGWLNYSNVIARSESGVYGKMYDLISAGLLENTQSAKNSYLREAEYRNTNWFDELFNTNIMQNHSVSFTSGTEKAQYYTSLSAVTDPGWARKSDVKRYTALINAGYNLYDNLKLNLRSNASFPSM